MLEEYPIEDWNGGKVQKITDNIIHLCRGNVFELDGKKIFAFGGAESHDKEFRKLGRTMWIEELPTEEEIEYGRQTLEAHNWKVDVIVTHTLPQSIQTHLYGHCAYGKNRLTLFFDELNKRLDYKMWFSGHYHRSVQYLDKHYLIYNNIVKLTENGFVRVYPLSEQSKYVEKLPDEI